MLQRARLCHGNLSFDSVLVHEGRAVISGFRRAIRVPFSDGVCQLLLPLSESGKLPSPEVYNAEPFDGFALDLWSSALMLFTMLCGNPPWEYPCESKSNLYGAIAKRDRLAETMAALECPLSPEAIDMLQCMVRDDPCRRLSLNEIQNHAWMTLTEEVLEPS